MNETAPQAERSILGTLLVDPDQLAILPDLRPDAMAGPHRLVLNAIRILEADGKPVDAVTVAAQLERTGKLELAGGPAFLAELLSDQSFASLRPKIEIANEQGMRRSLKACCLGIAADLDAHPPGEMLDAIETRLRSIRDLGQSAEIPSLADQVARVLDHSGARLIATGLPLFDWLL